MEKPFKHKTLRIVIKGDNVLLDNHCNIGRGLRQNSYVDKKHLLHLIKQMIDWDYDEITDTPKKRKENRSYKKWCEKHK